MVNGLPLKLVYWARFRLARAELEAALRQVPGATLAVVETLDQLLAELPGAAGLVLPDAPPEQARRLVEALAAPGRTLRWMHFITAGRNGFEAAGLPPGVTITWSPGALSPTVAEHAMALLLALARRVPDMVARGAQGHWDAALGRQARALEGGTLLVVGLGHIGRELARRARAFGMRVEAVTRTPQPDPLVDAAYPLAQLHERLAQADAIVLCLALTPRTTRIIDAAALACCRRQPLLVNIGRGGLVDHAALDAALAAGQLGGAALDVTDPEPLPPGHPLWQRALISPHFAGLGSGPSMERLARSAAENARRLVAGEELVDRIG